MDTDIGRAQKFDCPHLRLSAFICGFNVDPKWEGKMNVKIGSAPDSWGVWFPNDPKQTPWQRYLDEVVEAGYEWTELGPYGYLPTEIPTLRRELEKRGLKVSASVVMANLEEPSSWPEVERQTLGVGEQLSALGAEFLVRID